MRINKLHIGLLLIVAIVVHPATNDEISSDDKLNMLNAGLPGLTGVVTMVMESSPAGPFIAAGLGFVHVLSMIFFGADDEPDNTVTKIDLQDTQKVLMNKMEEIDNHISESTAKIISELTHTVESFAFLEDMRNTLESLMQTYKSKIGVILNPRNSAMKRRAMEKMLDDDSSYRTTLRSFVTKFIKPKVVMATSGPIKLFYDFLLQKNNMLAAENDDCVQDSLHFKIYKSYMFIAKVLTDAYAMGLSAHAIQYQQEIRENNRDDAYGTKKAAQKLMNEFRSSMRKLMLKTKNALRSASREIRNCGTFSMEEGKTFARLPFATSIPQFYGWGNFMCQKMGYGPTKVDDYKIGNCSRHEDLVPSRTVLELYHDANNVGRPYAYAKFGSTKIGHEDSSPNLKNIVKDSSCDMIDFCPAYRKRAVGISLQRVHAKPGNVITGVRWRLRKDVLYIDIQEGKWVSALEVDPKTVRWTQTPEDPYQVAYLSTSFKKVEIANHMLDDGELLTAIQLDQTNLRNGMIKLFLQGAKPPKLCSYKLKGNYDPIDSNEIKLEDRDDPEKAPNNIKRLISIAPEPTEPAFIEFQLTSFKKDLARTTIPYIDLREVVTNPPSAVAGIGIYHEAAKDEGGLLALRLFAPDLTDYIDYSQIEKITNAKPKGDRHGGHQRNNRS